jgi:hypothetical protein
MAYESGMFRKYGLDAELIFVESGSTTVKALISGDVVAAQLAGTSLLQSKSSWIGCRYDCWVFEQRGLLIDRSSGYYAA